MAEQDFVPDYEDVEFGAHHYHLEQSTNGSATYHEQDANKK